MHRRIEMITDYGIGPMYLAAAILSCTIARCQTESSQEALPLYVVQMIATGAILPWTALACSALCCHGLLKGNNLGFAASGFASGVCLFTGFLTSAVELGEY
jgi:hypothetical protein